MPTPVYIITNEQDRLTTIPQLEHCLNEIRAWFTLDDIENFDWR